MVTIIFRSRLRPEHEAEYNQVAEKIDALVRTMPGLIAFKTFGSADGERVTLAEFDTLDNARHWGENPDHLEAQRLGRERFYSEYRVQVCEGVRAYSFAEGRRTTEAKR
jgi:antibiotic biosynthesis monooxygenase (ABM) superfamily enzyme